MVTNIDERQQKATIQPVSGRPPLTRHVGDLKEYKGGRSDPFQVSAQLHGESVPENIVGVDIADSNVNSIWEVQWAGHSENTREPWANIRDTEMLQRYIRDNYDRLPARLQRHLTAASAAAGQTAAEQTAAAAAGQKAAAAEQTAVAAADRTTAAETPTAATKKQSSSKTEGSGETMAGRRNGLRAAHQRHTPSRYTYT
jgi:hypothetical protein